MPAVKRAGTPTLCSPSSSTPSAESAPRNTRLEAAAANPLLSTFASDADTAGITSELNGMHAFTVFAPANDAFAKLPSSEMTMMRPTAELAKILKYHVVAQSITPAEIAAGQAIPTLEGDTLTPSKMGSVYEVNNASIICGNIHAENATVHIIKKVLTQMH